MPTIDERIDQALAELFGAHLDPRRLPKSRAILARLAESTLTLDSFTATWRELMNQFSLPAARKAVAGETLTHLGGVLVELGSPNEGKRMRDLGCAFLGEVAGFVPSPPDPEEEFLAESASRCACCGTCSPVPCAGVTQGASCDDRCVCGEQWVDGS